MKNFLFKINDNSNNAQPVQAAIISCLRYKEEDTVLFKTWFERELPKNMPDRDKIVQERVGCALRCRELLKIFEANSGERKQCIDILARLILAKYSGKSQSYLAKGEESIGSIDLTLGRIVYAVSHKQPLIFLFCFGGYKNHNCPTYPEVDWAEFFQLKFFIEYLLPIIKNYKYGTLIQYESEDIIIESNNVPRKSLDAYSKSFTKLLNYMNDLFKEQFGIELNIELIRCRDQYDVHELYGEMAKQRDGIIEAFSQLSDKYRLAWLKRAETNIMWEGGVEDYSNLSPEQREKIIFEARIANECFLAADYILRGKIVFDRDNCVPFVGTWGYTPSASPIDFWFHLKSSQSSQVDFWIGTGLLSHEVVDGKDIYKERIVSPPQYKAIENCLEEVSIENPKLTSISKNFKNIKIYNGKFPY